MSSSKTDAKPLTMSEVMNKAAASALRGGTAGACAMGANVACLMWMRTTVRILITMPLVNSSCLKSLLTAFLATNVISFLAQLELGELSISQWYYVSRSLKDTIR